MYFTSIVVLVGLGWLTSSHVVVPGVMTAELNAISITDHTTSMASEYRGSSVGGRTSRK